MPTTAAAIQSIPLDQIVPSPYQTRKNFDPEKLQELAATLKEHGLMNAICVRPVGDQFELIAGERRVRAAKLLGWTTIDAKVEEVPDTEAAERVVVENLQREDLNPIEQAEGYKRLKEMGLTLDQIAEKVGVGDKGTISRFLALLGMPQEIQDLLPRGNITEMHTRFLRKVEDGAQQIKLAKQADREGWSVKETERQVNAIVEKKPSQHSALGTQHSGLREKQPEVQWRGEEIVINRHFRPVTESLVEYVDWLTRTVKPMLLVMPGLKDSPKGEKALAKAQEQVAAQANAEAQKQVDAAVSKMSAAQQAEFAKQVEEANAQDERENAAEHERVQKLLAEEQAMYSK